jgi:hypothetical protein
VAIGPVWGGRLDVGGRVGFASAMKAHTVVILGLLSCPAVALAWTSDSPFSATVLGHAFKHVSVRDEGCAIKTVLKFSAPEGQYREPAKVRNYYRFKARVRFASGKKALSPVFFSQKPGDHQFEFAFDSTADGCWARSEQKVIGVDVEGCRGKGCVVEPFQN